MKTSTLFVGHTRLARRALGLALLAILLLGGRSARADGTVPGYILTELSPAVGLSDVLKALHGDVEEEESYVFDKIENTRIYALRVPVGESESGYARRVSRVTGVLYAEPDTYFGDPKSLPFGFVPGTLGSGSISDFISERASMEQLVGAGVAPAQYFWQPAFLQIGLRQVALAERGKGVKVAVLDTGVTPDHPTLYGRCTQGYNALDPSQLPLDLPDGLTNRSAGHGTMIAGLIARIAPDVELVPVRVLNAEGVGTGLSVAKGVYYSVSEGARVLNLSFGSATPSRTLNVAIAHAVGQGVLPVASAGNDGVAAPRWPAACRGVLGVASVESDHTRSLFSNFGSHVSICAPGSNLLGAHYDGGFARWSGTSFAAPLVSAQAALLIGLRPERTGRQVAQRIQATARRLDLVNPLFSGQLGAGLIQLPASLW